MLRAFGHPVQHAATMLQDVALKCCEHLARPLRCDGTSLPSNDEILFDKPIIIIILNVCFTATLQRRIL